MNQNDMSMMLRNRNPSGFSVKDMECEKPKDVDFLEKLLRLQAPPDMDHGSERIFEMAQRDYPGIIAKVYPRRYRTDGAYHNPKNLACAGVNAYICAKLGFSNRLNELERQLGGPKQLGDINLPALSIYRTLTRLTDFQMPTYFVSKGLLTALLNTDLPELRLCDLKWPLDALLFVLPSGGLQSPVGECEYIGIARHAANVPSSTLLDEDAVRTPRDVLTAFCGTADKQGTGFTWYHPINEDPLTVQDPVSTEMSPTEAGFLPTMQRIVLQLLLTMTVRPDLVSRGTKVKDAVVDSRKHKAKPELWSPNIIGQTYQSKTESEDGNGTHESPRCHWRRGHFRLYEKGEHWKVTKQVWIEPVLINP